MVLLRERILDMVVLSQGISKGDASVPGSSPISCLMTVDVSTQRHSLSSCRLLIGAVLWGGGSRLSTERDSDGAVGRAHPERSRSSTPLRSSKLENRWSWFCLCSRASEV